MRRTGYSTLLLVISIYFVSCDGIANRTKKGINRSDQVVGETATEFIEGVTQGVDKTLECEIVLSDKLKELGLKTGV